LSPSYVLHVDHFPNLFLDFMADCYTKFQTLIAHFDNKIIYYKIWTKCSSYAIDQATQKISNLIKKFPNPIFLAQNPYKFFFLYF